VTHFGVVVGDYSGVHLVGDYYHSKGVKYALYTAESPTTCGGYPASAYHEMLDARTFAEWGVDYMKVALPPLPTSTPRRERSERLLAVTSHRATRLSVNQVDGCGPPEYYDHGYKAMGAALESSGRPIEYSCSWPAYINGGNESKQPFATFIEYGVSHPCLVRR
jgi:hypothetical protein